MTLLERPVVALRRCSHLISRTERTWVVYEGVEICLPCAFSIYKQNHDARLWAAAQLGSSGHRR
jgi:hypothetical protein